MKGSLAAWLSSWSKQTPMKSRYISSTTGRMPAMAAPTPRPTIAVSEIGVSRTRSPNSLGAARGSARRRCRPRRRRRRRRRPARPRRARPRGRDRMASMVRNTGASSAGGGGLRRAPAAAARRSRSAWPAAGRASRRARLDGAVELGGHRRLERLDLVVADAGVAEPALVDEQRVARRATPRPRPATGSARGRPRSGRASGRWPPRRR